MKRRRVSEFDPDAIAGVPVDVPRTMGEARQRLARREAARQPELPPPPDFGTRLAEAAARVAPEEPVPTVLCRIRADFFISSRSPRTDLAMRVSPKTL